MEYNVIPFELEFDLFGYQTEIDCDYQARYLVDRLDILIEGVENPMVVNEAGDHTVTVFGYDGLYPRSTGDEAIKYAQKVLNDNESLADFILSHSEEYMLEKHIDPHEYASFVESDGYEEYVKEKYKEAEDIHFHKVVLNKDVKDIIKTEAEKIQNYLTEQLKEYERQQHLKDLTYAEERTKFLDGVKWSTIENVTDDENGKIANYTHTIIVNGETFVIIERHMPGHGWQITSVDGDEYDVNDNGKWCLAHYEFTDNEGWIYKPINENHAYAAEIISRYGKSTE